MRFLLVAVFGAWLSLLRNKRGSCQFVLATLAVTCKNPTYEQVCSHATGQTEAGEVIFDKSKISYAELVEIYWAQTDPTEAFGQFEDRSDNHRPGIFCFDERQKETVEYSKAALQASGRFEKPVVTTIEPAQPFYGVEVYHQRFYKTNLERYAMSSSLRHQFLRENWQ